MNGITYVVTHSEFRAVKVGYSSTRSNRLENLGNLGWHTYRYLSVASRELARQIEQAAIFELRFRLYVPPYLTDEQLVGGGKTETASAALVSAAELWEIVCEQAGLLHLASTSGRGRWLRNPPVNLRRKGDTPRYGAVARKEARLEQLNPKKR